MPAADELFRNTTRLRAVPDSAVPAELEDPRPTRRSSRRERHDEKITVYTSSPELVDLEQTRVLLRGQHGLAVDRGRIVREAVAAALEDFAARGERSTLVRRLREG
jgi:hypothetical protein